MNETTIINHSLKEFSIIVETLTLFFIYKRINFTYEKKRTLIPTAIHSFC
jgi:hypothetical protein